MTKEELEKSLNFVNEERERLQRELERKDNIISELKKYCEENIDDLLFECEAYYKDILDKIKELENDNKTR